MTKERKKEVLQISAKQKMTLVFLTCLPGLTLTLPNQSVSGRFCLPWAVGPNGEASLKFKA